MRVLRVYHAGRIQSERERERALAAIGAELTLVIPSEWPGTTAARITEDAIAVQELAVRRTGDVNRHTYANQGALKRLFAQSRPDVLDIHEEPFSAVAHQLLAEAPHDMPVVMYAAQNVDKRLPPPFFNFERDAYDRSAAVYACSRQAASVARGKGFGGEIDVLPLGYDPRLFFCGEQSVHDPEVILTISGRLVREKGVCDAVAAVARLNVRRHARLVIVGDGPERDAAQALASALGIANRVQVIPWLSAKELGGWLRRTHIVFVPSTATRTWAEQFGRVVVEGQASGAVVIGYASGAIPEVGGDAIALVPEGRIDLLAQRAEALFEDEAAWQAHRQAGLKLAELRTWDRIAVRQLDLYERVAAGSEMRVPKLRDGKQRRLNAVNEFGPTAITPSGTRPFALPFLRSGGWLPDSLGRAIDIGQTIISRTPQR